MTLFFLGKLLLINQYFFCEKCQYALIVSALVSVNLIICDLGNYHLLKKSWFLGIWGRRLSLRAGQALQAEETKHQTFLMQHWLPSPPSS